MNMGQAKFSFRESQENFISCYKLYGYKDKSAMVRAALDLLQTALEKEKLKESAILYAETYAKDEDLKELTDSALAGWPE
jgi:hypothetical protein